MKLFFSDRVFCFGCSVNTSKPEIISADDCISRRRTNQRKSTKHWRPVLKAIEEDGVHRRSPESTAVARSEKNLLAKPKSARRTRSESFHDDYWKSSHEMIALPVFSPTPFMF
ncbi:unnamed protein product [Lactuca virosa]|uniref:Uncharacterized protein n=1 Tax=Lactuca virosa TaxID=75947 RepID=A0AAU9MNL7_9ASTR|nr:unnamed protein product [Lactuca virosa]